MSLESRLEHSQRATVYNITVQRVQTIGAIIYYTINVYLML